MRITDTPAHLTRSHLSTYHHVIHCAPFSSVLPAALPLHSVPHTLVQMTYKVDSHWIKCYKMSLWRRSHACSLTRSLLFQYSVVSSTVSSLCFAHYIIRWDLFSTLWDYFLCTQASSFILGAQFIHSTTHSLTMCGMAKGRRIDIRMRSDICSVCLCVRACAHHFVQQQQHPYETR